jgi:hypothetical protein
VRTRSSFDIHLTGSAIADLDSFGGGAGRCIRQLYRLTDDDIHQWEPLPLPRGDEGSWVVFPLCRRVAMCQFAKGTPRLWGLGAGRGCLKVVRIVDQTVLAELVASLEAED